MRPATYGLGLALVAATLAIQACGGAETSLEQTDPTLAPPALGAASAGRSPIAPLPVASATQPSAEGSASPPSDLESARVKATMY